jgi:2-polyprenyl-6-methoxyphenol hydroxylase-like FAD-dependent oxidoreductase
VREPDLVIVGGGIAGGTLAVVMSRAGARVLMLERQSEYRDQVRGEILWPWGVRLARQLGVEQLLLHAGAQVIRWFDLHDEGTPSPAREDVGAAIADIDGSLNVTHPTACGALAAAAAAAGANVRMGVRQVDVAAGSRPFVQWLDDEGIRQQVRSQLVVGADGRRSSVRRQVGAAFEIDKPAHLVAGMLVQGVSANAQNVNLQAREADLLFFSFPEEDGKARLYLCFPTHQRSRFAGRDGYQRFLRACKLDCLEGVAAWDQASPAGPCATFTAEDSRAAQPLTEGVVLIGDAAGYENPLQGQGLSMALQDVSDVSAALLSERSWSTTELAAYATARAVRQRLANLGVALEVWANDGFAVQDSELRAARYDHIRRDGVLAALEACFMTGFDTLPQDLTRAELDARLPDDR